MSITQEELKKLLSYDPDTGVFVRLIRKNQYSEIGSVAGWDQVVNCGKRYRMIGINNKTYLEHRLVWLYVYGFLPEGEIDHINGNGCDNRLINLRAVSRCENRRNVKKQHNNTSGICGVDWHKQISRWRARIAINKNEIQLGVFDNIFDAACARKNAEKLYGFHKNHGSDRPL